MDINDNIYNHTFIVFCEDHYNSLSLIRSLGMDGVNSIIVLVGENPYLITSSKFTKNIINVNSIQEGYDYIMENFTNQQLKPFLYSCSDNIESFLDNHFSDLNNHFYFFNGGKNGQITKYMDKETILLAAKECGINVPKSERVSRGEQSINVPFPIITKSISSNTGGWKNDVFICRDKDDLNQAYKQIKSDPVLIEEYIEKKNELCIDGISFNGGEEIYMPFKVNYLRFTPKAYGNYMMVSPFDDKDLSEKISLLFKKTKFSGIFSIEFLISPDGEYKFLEINFRHSTWAYSSLKGGANLPLIWANSCIKGYLDTVRVNLKSESFTAMAELADFNDHVRHGDLSLWQWLKDFHNCPCTYIYHPNDKKPFWATVKHSIKLLLNKYLNR